MPSCVHCPYSNLFFFKQSFSLLCTRIKLEQELSLWQPKVYRSSGCYASSLTCWAVRAAGATCVWVFLCFFCCLISEFWLLVNYTVISTEQYSGILIDFFFLFYHSVSWCNGDITVRSPTWCSSMIHVQTGFWLSWAVSGHEVRCEPFAGNGLTRS